MKQQEKAKIIWISIMLIVILLAFTLVSLTPMLEPSQADCLANIAKEKCGEQEFKALDLGFGKDIGYECGTDKYIKYWTGISYSYREDSTQYKFTQVELNSCGV